MAADHGNEEMDLLHYAMVGGMNVNELPDEQVERYNQWFSQLPEDIKKCYHEPNLQNVLDTHTNKLYEQAAGYYTQKTGKAISEDDAQRIIRTTFTCLTKIDQGRAVRNRMTLQEITNILGHPLFDTQAVNTILNIFREPGNTFIHPFIIEDNPESHQLEADQVLDITHESLIRNWKFLGQWAKEEYDSRSVSLDFEQQLGRWVSSGKSNEFLLSIGPLTYFEGWYNKVKPNAWWIARYLPDETNKETKLAKSKEILGNAQEFLKKSANKHLVTRTVMRYGPKRIAATLGILAMITLTSFAVRDYFNKQNAAVLKNMHRQTLGFVNNPKVTLVAKARLAVEELKLGQASVREIIDVITDTIQKINIADAMATQMVFQGRDEPSKEILLCLSIADSLLTNFTIPLENPRLLATALKEINDLRAVLELGYTYNADPQLDLLRKRNAQRAARWVMKIMEEQPAGFKDMQEFSIAMENGLNYKSFTKEEINKLISILSPFENPSPSPWLQSNFQQDKIMIRGEQDYGFLFNGLYQELAYLYAAEGNSQKVLQCIDTLFKYSQNNYQGDYAAGADNAANIAAVYFNNDKGDQLDEFVKGYCLRKKITEEEFYARLLGRTIHERATVSSLDLLWWMNVKLNLNLRYSDNAKLSFFFKKYRESVESTIKDIDQRNLLIALSYKNEGILKTMHDEVPGKGEPAINDYFDQAVSWFNKVTPAYLQQPEKIIGNTGADEMVAPRKTLFIYPDLRLSFHPLEPRAFMHFYFNDMFMEYIISKNLFDIFYPGKDELKTISDWLHDYNVKSFVPPGFLINKARYDIFKKLAVEIERRRAEQSQDFNILYLYLGREAQEAGEQEKMLGYYRKIQPNNLLNILRGKEYANNVNNHVFRHIAFAVKGLTQAGQFGEAYKIITVFKKPSNRSSLYAFAAAEMLNEKMDMKLIQPLIDSAKSELNRAQNVTGFQPNRQVIAFALSMQDPGKNMTEINRLIKNLPQKLAPIQATSRAFAFHNQLYNAQAHIPTLISTDDLALSNWFIYYGYSLSGVNAPADWNSYDRNNIRTFYPEH